jgi:hypothetical protein
MLRSENACHDKGLEPRTTAALSAGLNRAHAATDAPAIERERPVFDDVTITFTERTPVSACGLTFELSGRQRQGAWAARRMIDSKSLAAQVLCRWRSALERRVRPHRVALTVLVFQYLEFRDRDLRGQRRRVHGTCCESRQGPLPQVLQGLEARCARPWSHG